MKRIFFIMSVVALALSMNACKAKQVETKKTVITANPATSAKNELVDKHWKLIELSGKELPAGENAPAPFLVFNDKRFSGNAGCNRISGSYELNTASSTLTFSQAATTKMMCINGMEVETEFLQMLSVASEYEIKNDTLTLFLFQKEPVARFVVQK